MKLGKYRGRSSIYKLSIFETVTDFSLERKSVTMHYRFNWPVT